MWSKLSFEIKVYYSKNNYIIGYDVKKIKVQGKGKAESFYLYKWSKVIINFSNQYTIYINDFLHLICIILINLYA